MKFRIGVIILFIFVAFPSVAQDFEIVPLGQMSPGTRMTFGVDPDDMGRAVGRVMTCDGKAVEGAVASYMTVCISMAPKARRTEPTTWARISGCMSSRSSLPGTESIEAKRISLKDARRIWI